MDFKLDEYVNKDQMQKFDYYREELVKWNENINLTAIVEKEEVELKHFYDSIIPLKYIDKNSKVIDVGTGAGFPGIPLKIVDDSIELCLLDSLVKRVKFLEHIIEGLNLERVSIYHGRAEEFAKKPEFREKYDVAISRAVAPMNVLVEYLLPFVKVGGICICMKGPNAKEELENANKAIKVLGGKLVKLEEIELPGTDMKRDFVIIKKVANTSKKFPRNPGTPSKKPIM